MVQKKLKIFEKIIPKITKKAGIFFDRDGVINIDNKYVFKIKDFIFKSNIIKTLKKISQKNYYIFIVTNQAGIAHGIFKFSDFLNLQLNLKKVFIYKKKYIN